jgi:hypothetical protein
MQAEVAVLLQQSSLQAVLVSTVQRRFIILLGSTVCDMIIRTCGVMVNLSRSGGTVPCEELNVCG